MTLKILVLSDIHAFKDLEEGRKKPSNVEVGSEKCSLLSFEELIKKGEWNDIDYILSPGDFSDQADCDGIKYVWRKLNSILEKSENSKLLATSGNHDIDSRFKNSDYCAKETLLELKPSFPCVTDEECYSHKDDFDRQLWFWARNFYMYSTDECRFLCLNSAAYHGQGIDDEFEHGRISGHTLKSIREVLDEDDKQRKDKDCPLPKLNILLCHHHLQKEGTIDDTDSSAMKGAHVLIDFLNNGKYGRWLFIHGHRHLGRLSQIGGANGSYVLSASSFGAKADEEHYNFSNQAHFVELDFEAMDEHQFYPAGKIVTLTWVRGIGWTTLSSPAPGMPPITSFGYRGNIDQSASDISALLKEANEGVKWEDVLSSYPNLDFLDYAQIDQLNIALNRDHNAELKMSNLAEIEFVLPKGDS